MSAVTLSYPDGIYDIDLWKMMVLMSLRFFRFFKQECFTRSYSIWIHEIREPIIMWRTGVLAGFAQSFCSYRDPGFIYSFIQNLSTRFSCNTDIVV